MAHLIIGGRDTRSLGLTLTSVDMRPPEPKEILVSGNGFDGSIDLTSWTGRTFYDDRYMKFEFVYTDYLDPTSFENAKDDVTDAFHGKRLTFSTSWEPDATYEGRWQVETYPTDGHHGTVNLVCKANPYKRKLLRKSVSCCGGVFMTLGENPDEVIPTVTSASGTSVEVYKGGYVYTPVSGEPSVISPEYSYSSENSYNVSGMLIRPVTDGIEGALTVGMLDGIPMSSYSDMSVAQFSAASTHPDVIAEYYQGVYDSDAYKVDVSYNALIV